MDSKDDKTRLQKIEDMIMIRSVRNALVDLIPILILGAFALIFQYFPSDAYQNWIATAADGILLRIFKIINSATFGMLSVYMTFCVSRAYISYRSDRNVVGTGAIMSSGVAFFILVGADLEKFGTDRTGPKSMFVAIITGILASWIYIKWSKVFKKKYLFTSGADRTFNRMLNTFFPIVFTVIPFALLNALVIWIFDLDSFKDLIALVFKSLFSSGETGFFKGFFFVLLSSVLWFFGIHGSDTLEDVMHSYFYPGLEANQQAVAAGSKPTVILTKEFFDCFVLMGGCGATICLLIAILIFSKSRSRKTLGLAATFPMIFNINELMVFGLPIILNPVMVIPFLTVPLLCYSISYMALYMGWVPLITHQVNWTTPVLMGGYCATGSYAGSVLQLVNIVVGVLVYAPFIRILDKQTMENMRSSYSHFIEFFKQNEGDMANIKLTERYDSYGDIAKELCSELKQSYSRQIVMYYQPQYHYDGRCIGVESLLRWNHPVYGMIYPPLIIKLAEEGGFLEELEEKIWENALADRPYVLEMYGENTKLSVNVTGTTIVDQRFLQFMKKLDSMKSFAGCNICVEVTEQATLSFDDKTIGVLNTLKGMGLLLAIDDFSMGHTSIHYLKDNLFDLIKLDGSLVRGMYDHENSREIITSITKLADNLGLMVIAEYVENEKQRKTLHEYGCDLYQGYLFSAAVPVVRS